MYHYGYMTGFSGTVFWVLGWLFMLSIWALIILGVIAILKWLKKVDLRSDSVYKTPLEILKKRYAKGEIEKEEFEEKRRIIQG